jgi:thrombospondin type 3 repeat protein
MRYWPLLWILAACPSSRQGQTPADGSPDAPRPIDASPDAPLPDMDGDGIPDIHDNCPTIANPTQSNVDGDAYGDVCDICPVVADNGLDTDGDGVGDECDPHPLVPGDHIVFFEAFDHGAPAGATLTGNWTFPNHTAQLDATAGSTDTMTWPGGTAGSEALSAGYVLDELIGPNTLRGIGPIVQLDASGRGVACEPMISAGNLQSVALLDTGTDTQLLDDPAPVQSGVTYMAAILREGTKYSCISSHSMPFAKTSTLATGAQVRGIRGHSASAHFQWVMLVEGP